jgi:YEATS domain-containing protein 1/3
MGKDERIEDNKLSSKEIYNLYEQITQCEDTEFLQKVVDVIETTGLYTVAEKTFEFDLCRLDKKTLQKLQKCLGLR